ncbi:DUF4097 family beta strand repeat-containing protein [Lachnospira multipara]|uniref:DUF4097 family beta strand repeat-containing protein n=1 Tax=Lachnospira multipara TaxID=28051 RepID=UPI0004823C84|nr:DUF4097 family beta strand repeat-containing protein [Lachnospira multipara]
MSNKAKKKYKIVLYTITLIAVLLGLYINVFRYSFNFDFSGAKSSTIDYSGKEVNQINANIDAANVRILYGDSFKVEYNLPSKSEINANLEDGNLTIEENNSSKVVGVSFFGNNSGVITITLPYDTNLDKIDIDLSAGNIDIDEIASATTSIKNSAGNVELYKVSIENLNINTSVGNVKVTDCTVNDCIIDVKTGNIKVKDSDIETGSCTCQVGNVKISGDIGDLKADSKLGNVKVNGE